VVLVDYLPLVVMNDRTILKVLAKSARSHTSLQNNELKFFWALYLWLILKSRTIELTIDGEECLEFTKLLTIVCLIACERL